MAQTKPQETRTKACGILFVIEKNPEQTTAGYPIFTFLFLLRQPEDYFVAWRCRWMKSCNARKGALSDFLQTAIHLSFFLLSTNLLLINPRQKQNKQILQNFKHTNIWHTVQRQKNIENIGNYLRWCMQ